VEICHKTEFICVAPTRDIADDYDVAFLGVADAQVGTALRAHNRDVVRC
jgi:hypothetical protein